MVAGIAAWFVVPDRAGWIAVLTGTTGLAIFAMTVLPGHRLGRAIGCFGLAVALGCGLVWLRAERVAAPRLDRPRVEAVTGRVARVEPLPARDLTRLTVDLTADPARPILPPRVRVNVPDDLVAAPPLVGDMVSVRVRLMPPSPPALPGAYDFARLAWFEGLGATGRALGPVAVTARAARTGPHDWLAAARGRLSAHIQSRIAGSAGGVATAFVTGDEGAISDDDAEAMRRSGLAHLLSISGLHVTAVVGATMLITLRLLALSPWLALRLPLPLVAAGLGALAAIGYTLLSGAEVPTVRSCVAALLVLGGLALGREAITLRLVATGALIVLLFWPEAAAGPSFQMSFAAVTAIVALHEVPAVRAAFGRHEEGIVRRLLRSLVAVIATGLVIELALTPIALFHFHKAGLYGAIANTVAIPLSTFVIMPLEALALFLDIAGLGAPAWWLTGQAVGLLLRIARAVAAAPGAVTAFPSIPAAAFALMVSGLIWLALWRTRLRAWGIVPLAIGAIWAAMTPAPDLLVTGDGRHLAVRTERGFAILRPRAGDYMRDTLGELSGIDGEPMAIDALAGARCGRDLCEVTINRSGRDWHLLASRSPVMVPVRALVRACGQADIVVSDRALPRNCRPRWLKADRRLLARTGGIAINLAAGVIATVERTGDEHPWRLKRR